MELHFHIADYIVMGVFLLISLGIGIYYGLIRKQRTTEEYLLGSRQMHLLPVALSLLVTYQSAISVIGVPAEVYLYDTMFLIIYFGLAIATLIQYYLIVPLVYPLRLTSAYEYLGRRFESRAVQLMGTFLGMLQTLLYMSIVLLAPALALEAVAGIPLWISVVLVGIIGTVYTSLGGIKSVVWTDVFQCIILFVGLVVIIVLSRIKIGSFSSIWSLNVEQGRVVFDRVNGDPRIRHTYWTLLIGGAFNWLPNCCNQSAVQRICSMKNLRQSKIAVLLNIPLVIFYGILVGFTGIVMFAYFANYGCDPLAEGVVTNGNQITPYFVMHVLSSLPGFAGLFVAALFSGALSSLSSGINAMAANTIEDVLVNYLKTTSQWTQTLAAKLIVIVYGAIVITLAYLAKNLPGPITQIALSAVGAVGGPVVGMIFLGALFPQANWIIALSAWGAVGGPVVGMFFLGALFPQANWIGALGGGIIGLCINIWISICATLYGIKTPRSPSIGTYGCYNNQTLELNGTKSVTDNILSSTMIMNMTATISGDSHFVLYDISYLYFGMIGFFISLIAGIIISIIVGVDKYVTEPEYIFPCMRGFWRAGFKGTHVAPKFQVYRKQQKTNTTAAVEDAMPVISPIKKLDFTLYNKIPEADL